MITMRPEILLNSGLSPCICGNETISQGTNEVFGWWKWNLKPNCGCRVWLLRIRMDLELKI